MQVIRHRGAIVGFYLYTNRPDGALDIRCFNMDSAYAGGGFGKVVMNQELRERTFEKVIYSTCTAELPISSEYIFVNYETPPTPHFQDMPKSRGPLRFLVSDAMNDAISQAMRCASSAHG